MTRLGTLTAILGPIEYVMLAAAVAGLTVLGWVFVRACRGRTVRQTWLLCAPCMCLAIGLADTLYWLHETWRFLEVSPSSLQAYTGIELAMRPTLLAMLVTAALLLLQAMGLSIAGAMRRGADDGPVDLNRLAITGFTAMIAIGAWIAIDLSSGWRWFGFRSVMDGWFEVLAASTGIAVFGLAVASVRRRRRCEHLWIFGFTVVAILLVVATARIYADWLGYRTISMTVAYSRMAMMAAGQTRYVLLEHARWPELAAVVIVVLTGLPALVGAVPGRFAIRRRLLLIGLAAVGLPAVLSVATWTDVAHRVRSLETLTEARAMSPRGTPLAEPVDFRGQPVRACWMPRLIPIPGNTSFVQVHDGEWSQRPLLPMFTDATGSSEYVLCVPRGLPATELSGRTWYRGGSHFSSSGDLFVLLAEGMESPEGVLSRRSTPAIQFRWQGPLAVNAGWVFHADAYRPPGIWLLDADDDVLVVSPASSTPAWMFRDQRTPIARLQSQLAWNTRVYLVPGDHWTVQDLVSLCASAREVSSKSCTLVDETPESFQAFVARGPIEDLAESSEAWPKGPRTAPGRRIGELMGASDELSPAAVEPQDPQ